MKVSEEAIPLNPENFPAGSAFKSVSQGRWVRINEWHKPSPEGVHSARCQVWDAEQEAYFVANDRSVGTDLSKQGGTPTGFCEALTLPVGKEQGVVYKVEFEDSDPKELFSSDDLAGAYEAGAEAIDELFPPEPAAAEIPAELAETPAETATPAVEPPAPATESTTSVETHAIKAGHVTQAQFTKLSEAGFNTWEEVKGATDDTLLRLPGFGPAVVAKIRAAQAVALGEETAAPAETPAPVPAETPTETPVPAPAPDPTPAPPAEAMPEPIPVPTFAGRTPDAKVEIPATRVPVSDSEDAVRLSVEIALANAIINACGSELPNADEIEKLTNTYLSFINQTA